MKSLVVSFDISNSIEDNYNKIEENVNSAIKENYDLVVFSANALLPYYSGNSILDSRILNSLNEFNNKIVELSTNIAIVWGNLKYKNDKVFNCIYYAYDKEVSINSIKLRNNLQDDYNIYTNTEIKSLIEYKDTTINICNTNEEIEGALNIVFDNQYYNSKEVYKPKFTSIYINSLNVCSLNKNVLCLYGGVYYYKDNKCLNVVEPLNEGSIEVSSNITNEVILNKISRLDVLIYTIRKVDKNIFNSKLNWVIGLSGGLDSSVSVALLVAALGKDRVIGYNMASKYNSDITKDNASFSAKSLGIEHRSGSIEKLKEETISTLEDYGYNKEDIPQLAIENIQARLRGHLLNSFAAINNSLVCNNANKIELALGYCTMYGDAVGAVAFISDLTKVDLFELSKELNEYFNKEVIPSSLLPKINGNEIIWKMPPSAELSNGQLDPMKWFYHDLVIEELLENRNLDSIVNSFKDNTIYDSKYGKWIKYYKLENYEDFIKDINWVLSTMSRNAFKRIQLPPGVAMSETGVSNIFDVVQGVSFKLY